MFQEDRDANYDTRSLQSRMEIHMFIASLLCIQEPHHVRCPASYRFIDSAISLDTTRSEVGASPHLGGVLNDTGKVVALRGNEYGPLHKDEAKIETGVEP